MSMLEKLKGWLREKQPNYVEHFSMAGSTEGGFYSDDVFDFDKLCAEIDAFGGQLKANETADAKLLPPEPTHEMLRALAGDPALLAASDEAELRKRYQAMRDCAPTYVQGEPWSPPAATAISAVREEALKDAWDAVNALIQTGPTASHVQHERRNGLVMASNAIMALRYPPSISNGD
jgi:hypothetical protein